MHSWHCFKQTHQSEDISTVTAGHINTFVHFSADSILQSKSKIGVFSQAVWVSVVHLVSICIITFQEVCVREED